MFSRLFRGKRKFVAIGVAVVVITALGITLTLALSGPRTLSFQVTALDATVSSIKVPVNGEWKETGPIKVSLTSPSTIYPAGKLDRANKRAVVIWPVSISAPLLKELGLEKVDTMLVGVAKFVQDSPDVIDMLTVDFTVLKIPGIPSIVLVNVNNNKKYILASEPLAPGTELSGKFEPTEDCFRKGVDVRSLAQESFAIADQFMNFPVEDVGTFLDTVINLSRQNLHEIVVYIPEFNSYQTADLEGTDTLRIGR